MCWTPERGTQIANASAIELNSGTHRERGAVHGVRNGFAIDDSIDVQMDPILLKARRGREDEQVAASQYGW